MRIKVSFFTVIVVILAFFSHGLVPLTHVFAIMALHEADIKAKMAPAEETK